MTELQKLSNAYEKRFPSVKHLDIKEDHLGNKRFKASFSINNKQKTKRFGLVGAQTWYDGCEESKRNSYRARASKIKNKAGEHTYEVPGTANSFAYWILW